MATSGHHTTIALNDNVIRLGGTGTFTFNKKCCVIVGSRGREHGILLFHQLTGFSAKNLCAPVVIAQYLQMTLTNYIWL